MFFFVVCLQGGGEAGKARNVPATKSDGGIGRFPIECDFPVEDKPGFACFALDDVPDKVGIFAVEGIDKLDELPVYALVVELNAFGKVHDR